MKAYERIFIEQLHGLSAGRWQPDERITAPRPSCADVLAIREALRNMLPGEAKPINGIVVLRVNRRPIYEIDGVRMAYDKALAIVERQAA